MAVSYAGVVVADCSASDQKRVLRLLRERGLVSVRKKRASSDRVVFSIDAREADRARDCLRRCRLARVIPVDPPVDLPSRDDGLLYDLLSFVSVGMIAGFGARGLLMGLNPDPDAPVPGPSGIGGSYGRTGQFSSYSMPFDSWRGMCTFCCVLFGIAAGWLFLRYKYRWRARRFWTRKRRR